RAADAVDRAARAACRHQDLAGPFVFRVGWDEPDGRRRRRSCGGHVTDRVADIGARVRRSAPPGGRQNGEGMLERERIGLRAAFLLLPSPDQREILLPAEPADRPSGLGFGPAGYDAYVSIVRANGIECARLDEPR